MISSVDIAQALFMGSLGILAVMSTIALVLFIVELSIEIRREVRAKTLNVHIVKPT